MSLEQCLQLERWQGLPHIRELKQYESSRLQGQFVLAFGKKKQSMKIFLFWLKFLPPNYVLHLKITYQRRPKWAFSADMTHLPLDCVHQMQTVNSEVFTFCPSLSTLTVRVGICMFLPQSERLDVLCNLVWGKKTCIHLQFGKLSARVMLVNSNTVHPQLQS